MRLLQLLLEQDQETIRRLASEHLAPGESDTTEDACRNLEAVLRSPQHLRATLYNRRPPCFWILQRALDHNGRVSLNGLKEAATSATMQIAEFVSAGELGGKKESRELYRRVLVEAWRSDFELDRSEIALLGVLRQELGLSNTDHFLLEHHADLQQFWLTDHAFIDVLNGLRSSGICHVADGFLVIPTDLQPVISQVLGIEAGPESCARLYGELAAGDLSEGLGSAGLKTGGTKSEKIARLVGACIQPSSVLSNTAVPTIKDLCSKKGLKASGNKEDLIDRVVQFYATNTDEAPESEPPPPPPPEPRQLSPEAFKDLFMMLRSSDLSDILASVGARRVTGAKDHLVQLLSESPFSEDTLLRKMENKQLESYLRQLGLKPNGNKSERIERLLGRFSSPHASV